MSKKNFYSVAKGVNTGIFTLWNKCEASVHKFHHAVFKGFSTIDQAIVFLIADGTYKTCSEIPVYDKTTTVKLPKDFGHKCVNKCTLENLDLSIMDESSSDQENLNESILSENDTVLKQIANTDLDCETVSSPQILENEPKADKTACKSKPTANKVQCTQMCEGEMNNFMIQCNKCQGWTHYLCTKLPIYQLYLLVHTSRRYTCEKCSNVTPAFREKWASKLETEKDHPTQNSGNIDKTQEIVSRIDNSIVDTITSLHKTNQDDKIQSLQQELQNLKLNSKKIEHIELKLDDLTNAVNSNGTLITASSENMVSQMKDQIKLQKDSFNKSASANLKPLTEKVEKIETLLQTPAYENLTTKLESMATELEKININLEQTCKTLDQTVKAESKISKNFDQIVSKFGTSDENLSMTHRKLLDHDKATMPTRNETSYGIETSNRFTLLAEKSEKEKADNARSKVLIIGNSHIKRIQTDKFIYNSIVHKYSGSSFEEMFDKIEELDQDYDCIVIHVFTNNLRGDTPDQCVKKCDDYISAITQHCEFAKIVLSLPFLTLHDTKLNEKITNCNILLQYKYLNHSNVTISCNSGLLNGNFPVRKFFIDDGIHLSNQGINVFVSNMKYHIKKVLNIDTNIDRQNRPRIGSNTVTNRGRQNFNITAGQNSNKSRNMYRNYQPGRQSEMQTQVPPYYMYPWNQGILPPMYRTSIENTNFPFIQMQT